MKAEVKNWKQATKIVEAVEAQIETISKCTSYSRFGRERERKTDIVTERAHLSEAINAELTALDTLTIAINLRKADLNNQSRFLTLSRAGKEEDAA
jgi:hypothetical protein